MIYSLDVHEPGDDDVDDILSGWPIQSAHALDRYIFRPLRTISPGVDGESDVSPCIEI